MVCELLGESPGGIWTREVCVVHGLSEALCDDLAAVEACFLCPLPHLDASGRQLLLVEPFRHTREGYTSESMVRKV
jgi:hypothetical protein